MKSVLAALIIGGSLIAAAVIMAPPPPSDAPEMSVQTCITQANGKIIYAPCLR